MKKLLLLFCALLCLGGSEGWAADVTVTIAQSPSTTGDFSVNASISGYYTKWTAKGDVALVLTTSGNLAMSQQTSGTSGYGTMLALKTTTSNANEALTITAPANYYIKSYSLTARLYSSSTDAYSLTNLAGTSTPINVNGNTISENNICANSVVLNFKDTKAQSTNYLCITAFTVTLAATPSYGVSYTSSDVLYSTGTFSRTDGKTSTNSNNTWNSTVLSGLSMSSNYNSMGKETTSSVDYTCIHSGNSPTYTITAPTGYRIVGYDMSIFSTWANEYITPSGFTRMLISTSSSSPTNIYVTGLNTASTSFQRTGNSKFADIISFKVYLAPTYKITYNVVDGSGNTMASAIVEDITVNPATPTVPSSISNSFCNYGSFYNNSGLTGDAITGPISTTQTLYVGYSINTTTCPVTFSTVESPSWYYLQLRDIYPSAASADATNPTPSASKIATSGGAWLFIGDPYKFYLYNKLTGKYLEKSSAASGAANGTQFTSTPFEWQMKAHDAGGSSFRIYTKATASNAAPTHIFSNTTSIMWLNWNGTGSGEVGGKFLVSEYSDEFKDQVSANIKPFFDKYDTDGEVYFGISEATNTSYRTAYTSALSSCTEDNYNTIYTNVITNGLKLPTDGYYRLKNVSDGTKYLGYSSALATSTSTSAASVLYIDVQNDGTMSIALQGSNYIQMPAGQNVDATVSSTPMLFSATVVSPGAVSLLGPNPGNAYQCFGISGSSILGLSGSSTSAQWIFEDATSFSGSLTNAKDNTGTDHSYATLCVPFAISALTGADAYMPTKEDDYIVPGDAATVSDGTLIAAGTPVLLVGAKDAGTYTATIKTGSAPVSSPADTNVLTGTFTGASIDCTAATGTNYVLGFDENNSNRIGFYHVKNGSSFALKANRAYLSTAGGSVKGFAINWDELVDGLRLTPDPSLSTRGDETIYNLAGQKLSKPMKGVNIVNGKKVLVK